MPLLSMFVTVVKIGPVRVRVHRFLVSVPVRVACRRRGIVVGVIVVAVIVPVAVYVLDRRVVV